MLELCSGRRIGAFIGSFILLLSISMPAQAGMVSTDQVLHGSGNAAQREALVELMERDAVAAELETLGVAGGDARERVERLTDSEVAQLYGQMASLPAGGNVSTVGLLLIILLIVLLV